jgi:hypothetical protein
MLTAMEPDIALTVPMSSSARNTKGVYNEYDRLRAEGELRIAIAFPFFALPATISYLLIEELRITGDGRYAFYAVAMLYSAVRRQLVLNADTRLYGVEYFSIKYYGVDVNLEVLRPAVDGGPDQVLAVDDCVGW